MVGGLTADEIRRFSVFGRTRSAALKAVRLAAVEAMSEKNRDSVQPPMVMLTLSPGLAALSSLSWLRLPRSLCPFVSPTPVTLFAPERRPTP